MSLDPLFAAGPLITVHALAAMAAFVLGGVQLAAPKGALPHRTLGCVWVALMVTVAGTALFIYTLRLIGPFSPIHLLAIYTLISLTFAVRAIRKGDVGAHRKAMVQTYVTALIIAGAFTLCPGRIMHEVVFG
ncbi:MAG: DUF2306 domain-containing protein [Devosiaceae bacterium]|nr:DUF2306 domain-containing protein [Devosiaceae bacterium MH13]